MIPLLSKWLSKNKTVWLAKREAALQAEFAPQLSAIQSTCQHQLATVESQYAKFKEKYQELERLSAGLVDQEQILQDRKVAVERANEECRTQLRLLEAKASPDRVWVEAFSRGYQTAWETVWPIMSQGVRDTKVLIEQKAIEETLRRLDPVLHIRDSQALVKKREELLEKQKSAVSEDDQMRYAHYLTALNWMLDANGVHPHQPTT